MYKCIIVPHKNCIKESSRTFLKLKCSSCLSARFMDGWIDGWIEIDRKIDRYIFDWINRYLDGGILITE